MCQFEDKDFCVGDKMVSVWTIIDLLNSSIYVYWPFALFMIISCLSSGFNNFEVKEDFIVKPKDKLRVWDHMTTDPFGATPRVIGPNN